MRDGSGGRVSLPDHRGSRFEEGEAIVVGAVGSAAPWFSQDALG